MGPEGSLPSLQQPTTFCARPILSTLTYRISLRSSSILSSHLRPDLNSVHVTNEQDRQCTYSVTLRRARADTVAVGKQ